ncbi:MAG: hypothetical protein IKA76_02155 [Clostridia bacterium]|nr:hypothetical protein [Clostridia bacterium]
MAKKWTDRMATPMRDPVCVENIGELFMDSAKINIMRLMNCDEKYKKGWAPNFELIEEWERLLPFCKGSGVAALYEAELRWLGVDRMELYDRWNIGGDMLRLMDLSEFSAPSDQIHIDRFVSDFAKSDSEENAPLSRLICQIEKRIKSCKSKEFHLILEWSGTSFLRPNPHEAEQALLRMIRGEKYNEEERSMLLLQTVILLAKRVKKPLVLHLYGKDSYAPVFETWDYLRAHKLFSGHLFFGIFLDTATLAHEGLCDRFGESLPEDPILPHTELILTVPDFADGLSDRLSALFRLYPRGGVTFGGVLTDSPAYFVADRVALEYLN